MARFGRSATGLLVQTRGSMNATQTVLCEAFIREVYITFTIDEDALRQLTEVIRGKYQIGQDSSESYLVGVQCYSSDR